MFGQVGGIFGRIEGNFDGISVCTKNMEVKGFLCVVANPVR
jgi:hypothetical protein